MFKGFGDLMGTKDPRALIARDLMKLVKVMGRIATLIEAGRTK